MRKKTSKTKLATKFSSEFISLLKSAKLRGLWILASRELYQQWMVIHSPNLVTEYGGTYNMSFKKWYFPRGATLDLLILAKDENLEKLRGMKYNFVEVEGEIDKEIQKMATDLIAAAFRKNS